MTLTLINKFILNPFNVLYFITFKFIYFFTLQYAFVAATVSLIWTSPRRWTKHQLGVNENFKMTCHGLFPCDVTAVIEKLFIVSGIKRTTGKVSSRNPFNPLSQNQNFAILQPLSGVFKMFLCFLDFDKKGTRRVDFALLSGRDDRRERKGLISDGLESLSSSIKDYKDHRLNKALSTINGPELFLLTARTISNFLQNLLPNFNWKIDPRNPLNSINQFYFLNPHSHAVTIQKQKETMHSHARLFVCLIRKWCQMCLHCGSFFSRFISFVFLELLGINFLTPFESIKVRHSVVIPGWVFRDVDVCRVNRRRGLRDFRLCRS